MNIAIIEIYAVKKMNLHNAIDAHLRNSVILSKYFNCDLLVTESDFIKSFKKKYDVLILGYASGYAPFKSINKLIELNPKAYKYVLSNEYNIAPSIAKFHPYYLIANYEKKYKTNKIIKQYFLNLNLLFSRNCNEINNKKYDCIYYGTFRINRSKYFTEYLQNNIYLSTSSKNYKKFKHVNCNPIFIQKLKWNKYKETLNNFKYQLYIEDDYTHNNFNNLANRWYEAGFCNNVVFFDVNCRNTINKSELQYYQDQVANYIVESYEDLQNKIKECNKDFEKHLAIQKSWRLNEYYLRENMLKELKEIIYKNTNNG